jgi:membrane-associated phospholipid phosphatase
VPEKEEKHRNEGSYPSGHTMRGWTAALLLAEVNPAAADTIFARGWMYGESRVIVGAHWQSDVDASRTAASIGFCALQGSPEFIAQMRKAQQEYKEKTAQNADVHSATIVVHPATRAYQEKTKETRGIVTEGQQKVAGK